MEWSMDLGADYLATGHYANVRFNADSNEYELCKGADPAKDQSYFLFTMKQKDLARTIFPVGNFEKKQVRELARELGLLGVSEKPDSQEICFVQDKSYKDFIEQRVPATLLKPGLIVNPAGQPVGEHPGIHHFTIGQRKGVGVQGKEPLYVLEVNPERHEVMVGPESYLFKKSCTIAQMNWVGTPELDKPHGFAGKIRYRAKDSAVVVRPLLDRRVEVLFSEPQRAITPGQALVLYKEDRLVGGGWIETVA
jgi:tRNA-specific 2-thiouridylase